MDPSSDDFFGTLGGSLMKDLLADLQVDDGDFSLDQLEKELATLDHETPASQMHTLPSLDAASLVVSHAQERGAGALTTSAPELDAWSLSLQNFTAMSLQDDFLAADSARKKMLGSVETAQPSTLDGAEDYDVGEKPAVMPPPGLGVAAAAVLSSPPVPQSQPTPPEKPLAAPPVDPTPPGLGVHLTPGKAGQPVLHPPQTAANVQPTPPVQSVPVPPPVAGMPFAGMPPNRPVPAQMMAPQGFPPHMNMMAPPPVMAAQPQQPVVLATPAARGPAWQKPVAPAATVRAFCNPHPAAPPVSATVLASEFMSARDIAYVVHAIMKPILAEGVSENDYFLQFLRRLGGQANPSNPSKQTDLNEEMTSRANKTKEWASEKGVLGHVAKSNVTRPRALIAMPATSSSETDSDQKQRATLWKARIYCDQAYSSYQNVVDIWRSAPPGGVPPQVQKYLVKLMKCMGMTMVGTEYKVEKESLSMLIKMKKGRSLVARVLEQALLPPNAVQALLPSLLDVLLMVAKKQGGGKDADDMSDERLFQAVAGVLQKLSISSDTLLECALVTQNHGKVSLDSGARMACLHVLLQKGSLVVGQDPSEEKRNAWGKAEGAFLSMLQAY